jgi:hypothetical protein
MSIAALWFGLQGRKPSSAALGVPSANGQRQTLNVTQAVTLRSRLLGIFFGYHETSTTKRKGKRTRWDIGKHKGTAILYAMVERWMVDEHQLKEELTA